eukprot:scaffold3535_cov94-Skeletonema_dohrnii-CCMP3373.AAC.2
MDESRHFSSVFMNKEAHQAKAKAHHDRRAHTEGAAAGTWYIDSKRMPTRNITKITAADDEDGGYCCTHLSRESAPEEGGGRSSTSC